jgi:hypothetical protein
MSGNVTTTKQDIGNGFHRFLEGMEHRARNVLTFCSALQQRLSELDKADYDVPMPSTLKYAEYARTDAGFLNNYSEDRAESWLMELTRDVYQYAFPARGSKVETHVIYFCTSLEECQMGEEILSRCGQAYLETGSGFGVTAAELSVNSANTKDFTHGKALQLWNTTLRFRLHNYDFFSRNMDREEECMNVYEEYLEHRKKSKVRFTQDIKAIEDRKQYLHEEAARLKAKLEEIRKNTISQDKLRERLEAVKQEHAKSYRRSNPSNLQRHLHFKFKRCISSWKPNLSARSML